MTFEGPWPKGTLIRSTYTPMLSLWGPEDLSLRILLERDMPVMWLGCEENAIPPDFMNFDLSTKIYLLHEDKVWIAFLPYSEEDHITDYFEIIR